MDEFRLYFLDVITKKYVDCNGRARRKEYWMFELFQTLVILSTQIIEWVIFGRPLFFTILIGFGLFLPSFCLTIRRLHDLDKRWPWIFITLIPLVGGIWFFVLTVLPGTEGENRFGADTKADTQQENSIS